MDDVPVYITFTATVTFQVYIIVISEYIGSAAVKRALIQVKQSAGALSPTSASSDILCSTSEIHTQLLRLSTICDMHNSG